jgi:hypothetical protein
MILCWLLETTMSSRRYKREICIQSRKTRSPRFADFIATVLLVPKYALADIVGRMYTFQLTTTSFDAILRTC